MSAQYNTHFLIVDDDEVDVIAMKRILIEIDKDLSFSVASDGVEALAVLEHIKSDIDEPCQLIILLDLNMPKMGGHEFLEKLRHKPEFNDAIIYVLSTSDDPKDIKNSYNYFISGYISKDNLNADQFRDLFNSYLNLVTSQQG